MADAVQVAPGAVEREQARQCPRSRRQDEVAKPSGWRPGFHARDWQSRDGEADGAGAGAVDHEEMGLGVEGRQAENEESGEVPVGGDEVGKEPMQSRRCQLTGRPCLRRRM